MVKRIAISVTNLTTYLLLGLILIFYGIQLKDAQNLTGVLLWAGALFALLFLCFIIGFCLSQLFPDRRSNQFKFLFNVIETVCIVILLLAGMELSEKAGMNVVPLDEWQIESLGKILSTGREIYFDQPAVPAALLVHPGVYGTVRLASFLFYLAGTKSIVMTYFMLMMHLICAFATYRIARLLSGRVASIAVFTLMMIIPSQVCIVSVVNGYLLGSTLAVLELWLFLFSRRLARMERLSWLRIIILILCALLSGCAAFILPATLIIPFAEAFFICALQVNRGGVNPERISMRIAASLILCIGSIGSFVGLCALKAQDLSVSFSDVLAGFAQSFVPNEHLMLNLPIVWGTDSYAEKVLYFNTPLENRIAYGCILGLAFICLLLCWFLQEREFFVFRMYFLMIVLLNFLNGKSSLEHIAAMPVLCVFAGGLFEKIYNTLRYRAFTELRLAEGETALANASQKAEATAETELKADATTQTTAMDGEEGAIITVDSIVNTPPPAENNLPMPKVSEKKDTDIDFDHDIPDSDDWDV